MAQRELSAICPLAASPPHPLAQNRDVKPAWPIHSLFRWHKSHYKNFIKESWELKRPFPASAPELPVRGGQERGKKETPGSVGISKNQRGGSAGGTWVGAWMSSAEHIRVRVGQPLLTEVSALGVFGDM